MIERKRPLRPVKRGWLSHAMMHTWALLYTTLTNNINNTTTTIVSNLVRPYTAYRLAMLLGQPWNSAVKKEEQNYLPIGRIYWFVGCHWVDSTSMMERKDFWLAIKWIWGGCYSPFFISLTEWGGAITHIHRRFFHRRSGVYRRREYCGSRLSRGRTSYLEKGSSAASV